MLSTNDIAVMLSLLVAAVMYATMAPRLVRLAVDGDFSKIRVLFEPRWKREARALAALIPDPCAYCGSSLDPNDICPSCYAQLQARA